MASFNVRGVHDLSTETRVAPINRVQETCNINPSSRMMNENFPENQIFSL